MNTNSTLPGLGYVIASLRQWVVRETMTALKPQASLRNTLDTSAEQFRNSLRRDIMYNLNGRFERGVTLAWQRAVTSVSDPTEPGKHRLFQVKSSDQSRPPYHYRVDLEVDSCECPDYYKGHYCKHIIAAHIYELDCQNQQAAQAYKTQAPPVTALPKASPPKPATPPNGGSAKAAEPDLPTSVPKPKDSVIWAAIWHQGKWLGVEVLAMEGEKATIRALPKIIEGRKLQPQFPFEGKHSTTTVSKKELFHVKIFQ